MSTLAALGKLRDAQAAGHINIGDGERQPLEKVSQAAEAEALKQLELRKKARQIQVSTEDSEVKAYLRQLREPICLFGEDGADRRERLRMILAISGGPAQRPILPTSTSTQAASAEASSDQTAVESHTAKDVCSSEVFLCDVQVGDVRPLSACRFSPDGVQLATSSWSGLCRLWTVPECSLDRNLRGHTAPVCSIVWHPQARLQSEQLLALASSAQDGSVKLWSLDSEEPLADIEGHAPHRVSRVAFHPSGRFLATACFDHSWRLWDLEACEEVLHQEGHSKPVYDVAFHPDGSLALTTSLDSFARIWDLRTGRCIMFLDGHLEELLGADIADNGYHAATTSADNTVRIWDLRQQQAIYVLPAHNSVISSVRFEPRNCNYLLTSSFDKTAKMWGHPVWAPIKTLEGHNSKVVYADPSPDGKYIATCSHDLTYKLWTRELD
ncbi:hypothetical protein AHF37_04256 [Paragonimus kellicotti]|nr:hypothetical protein AHF37_04256 [Paragonimus kellicotti]